MAEPAVVCQALTRRFGDLTAVDGLELTIERGTVFGFLGPNGAGKTTTIRLLLGLLEPHAGGARVLGRDPWREGDALRAACGVLLEHDGLYTRLSARENLDFHAGIHHLAPAAARERIAELLDSIGLRARQHEVVGEWSRGMRQRLAVARALLARPAMVFLDEPTAGLDPVAAGALRGDLRRLVADEGVTVFLTTHNLSEAERLCEQVGILRAGRLLACGPPGELRAAAAGDRLEITGRRLETGIEALTARTEVVECEPTDGRLILRLAPGASAAPLVRLLVEQGAEVEEVRRVELSLEDVFVNLVDRQ